jgi:hypothetical protein
MSFSMFAVKNMNTRMSDYKNRVGSQLKLANPEKYKNFESADCITSEILL